MIQFNYTGEPFPSFERQQESKKAFIKKLGPFHDEFEQSGGIVTFNYSFPDTDTRNCSYVLDNEHDLSDFIIRWNLYIESIQ